MAGYPVDLDVRGRLAVVVGLGAVGRRKVLGLIEAGALVRGVDPLGAAWAADLGVDLRAEPYHAAHLAGTWLAIAASLPEVDRSVVTDARAAGILVASASDPRAGDFTLPAVWRGGPITLAVSTGWASPGLATALRDPARGPIGPEAAILAGILLDLRGEVLARIADPEVRRRAFREAAAPAWLDRLAAEGADATRRALRRAIGLDGPDPPV